MREAFRVLKPGGRLAVSDVVIRGEVPAQVRKSMELWVGCIAGALAEAQYLEKLEAAGFESIEVEPTRIYPVEEAREFLTAAGLDADEVAPQIKDKFMSAFLRAKKAVPAACACPPDASIFPAATKLSSWARRTTYFFFAPEIPRGRFWRRRF